MAVRNLTWRLPKLSREACDLERRLWTLLPLDAQTAVGEALQSVLTRHTHVANAWALGTIETTTYGRFSETVGDASVLAVVQPEAHPERILFELEADLARWCVARLLGDEGDARATEPVPLSESEQGVLQYLVMDALAAVHTALGTIPLFHWRFHRLIVKQAAQAELLVPRASVVVIAWRLQLGERVHVLRALIPHTVLQRATQAQAPRSSQAALLARARQFDDERCETWIEGGRCELSPADLASLEPGDVILLEDSTLQLASGRPTGDIIVRVGYGLQSGMRAQLVDRATLTCQVQGMLGIQG